MYPILVLLYETHLFRIEGFFNVPFKKVIIFQYKVVIICTPFSKLYFMKESGYIDT